MKKQREKMEAFATELAGHLGTNLKSLILFGSAVRSDAQTPHSEMNLLLIVDDASTSALRPIEPAISGWVKRREPAPLIFTEVEWRASTDVFPIEIEDMREAHELLRGEDPFLDITTSQEDLRRELEREVRGKLLQLRAEYVAVAPNGRDLTKLLLDSLGTFLILMRALARLIGESPASDVSGLINQTAAAAGLDPNAFTWVVDKLSGRTVHALKAYDETGSRYVDEMEKLAKFVDEFTKKQS